MYTKNTTPYKPDRQLLEAYRSPALPCNPKPFLNALHTGVQVNGTAWIGSDEAKALLFVINMQAYGCIFTLDALKEYERLNLVFIETYRLYHNGMRKDELKTEADIKDYINTGLLAGEPITAFRVQSSKKPDIPVAEFIK